MTPEPSINAIFEMHNALEDSLGMTHQASSDSESECDGVEADDDCEF